VSFFNNLIVSAVQVMPKSVVGFFSKRYIAGEIIDDAIRVTRELNKQGIYATIDVLGEAVKNREEAVDSKNKALEVLDTIIKFNLKANLSIKPTQMGMAIDEDFAYDQVRAIVQKAKEINSFIRIDMEDSPYTDATFRLLRKLKQDYNNVGVVVQAYLKRTYADVVVLNKIGTNYQEKLC
jgi:proline dehydrogenase